MPTVCVRLQPLPMSTVLNRRRRRRLSLMSGELPGLGLGVYRSVVPMLEVGGKEKV